MNTEGEGQKMRIHWRRGERWSSEECMFVPENKWCSQNLYANMSIAHNKWSRETWVWGITLGIYLTHKRWKFQDFASSGSRVVLKKKDDFFTCFSVTFSFSLLHITEIFHLYLFCHYSLCFVCWITMFGKDEHQKLKVNNVLVPEKAYIQ